MLHVICVVQQMCYLLIENQDHFYCCCPIFKCIMQMLIKRFVGGVIKHKKNNEYPTDFKYPANAPAPASSLLGFSSGGELQQVPMRPMNIFDP